MPKIGHADTKEGGHQPDRPNLNVSNALGAAAWLYEVIPAGGTGGTPWAKLSEGLTDAFKQSTRDDRIRRLQELIRQHTGDTNVNYKPQYFAEQSDAFEKELTP